VRRQEAVAEVVLVDQRAARIELAYAKVDAPGLPTRATPDPAGRVPYQDGDPELPGAVGCGYRLGPLHLQIGHQPVPHPAVRLRRHPTHQVEDRHVTVVRQDSLLQRDRRRFAEAILPEGPEVVVAKLEGR